MLIGMNETHYDWSEGIRTDVVGFVVGSVDIGEIDSSPLRGETESSVEGLSYLNVGTRVFIHTSGVSKVAAP